MAKILYDIDATVIAECNAGPTAFGIDLTDVGKETPQQRVSRKRKQAAEAARLIKHHVKPHVQFDIFVREHTIEEYACEHCGSKWTEQSDTYNGGCCAKDEDANPENAKAAESI